jgi:hypothetical protein
MKKLIFTAFAIFAFASISAQGFRAGANVGLPVGDAGDFYTFNVTLDLDFLWEVSETFDLGIATGLSYNFGEDIDLGGFGSFEVEDAIFLPIAVAGRFAVSDKFKLGADVGYGIGISPSENDGGFYYAPRLQYGVTEALDIVLAYRSVLTGGSFDNITLGVEFGL